MYALTGCEDCNRKSFAIRRMATAVTYIPGGSFRKLCKVKFAPRCQGYHCQGRCRRTARELRGKLRLSVAAGEQKEANFMTTRIQIHPGELCRGLVGKLNRGPSLAHTCRVMAPGRLIRPLTKSRKIVKFVKETKSSKLRITSYRSFTGHRPSAIPIYCFDAKYT